MKKPKKPSRARQLATRVKDKVKPRPMTRERLRAGVGKAGKMALRELRKQSGVQDSKARKRRAKKFRRKLKKTFIG